MEMKLENFRSGSVEEDSQEGTDGWVGNLRVATRERHISVSKYRQISIRYLLPSHRDTEVDKILDGRFKALLYIFEFDDAYIVCRISEIKRYLECNYSCLVVRRNPDNSEACYIPIDDIQHLFISK